MMQHDFTQFHSDSMVVDESGVTLPNQPARFVLLSNWNRENSAALPPVGSSLSPEEEPFELYYGYNGQFSHQLFVSQTTLWLPVTNLNQISVRSRPSLTGRIYFSWVQ